MLIKGSTRALMPNIMRRESKLLDERLLVDLPRESVTSVLSDQQVVEEDMLLPLPPPSLSTCQ